MDIQFEPKNSISTNISKHAETIVVGVLVAFYLFISNYFYWGATFSNGGGISTLPTSGGSDPYYNFIIILHILATHHQLVFDPLMNYPIGTTNPRNPFFHWFIVLIAEVLSPLVGAQTAAFYAFEEFDAFFGALLIIPVYLMTKEIFGKKAAGISALLYTLMPSNLTSGILSGGRMHTPELIFAFFTIYFLEKALKSTQKVRILENLREFRALPTKIIAFYNNNRIPTIYALMAGASMGGLMLSWQGYAYIEAIVLIYVVVQLFTNLILKRPTGYITYYTALLVILSFLMGAYYYQAIGEGPGWYNAELLIGILIVAFSGVINLVGRRPWILVLPVLIIVSVAGVLGLSYLAHPLFLRLISGDGYFIKTRVYQTIAEASAPQLGQYIGGFGIAQFLLGMSGIGYSIYLFIKRKSDELLLIIIFSLISIYMSFAAARFNVTAAPSYAILGSAMLLYFAKTVKLDEIKKRRSYVASTPAKAIKGNISWLHAVFVIFAVLLVLIPSGLFTVSASVPFNSAPQVNSEFASAIPSFLKSNNSSSFFVGGLSSGVANSSQPLSQSFAWFRTQDANLPINQKPAYLSWWDYGFQEMYQGQHPTVADDFQQGVQIAGQTLLAQNQSQILSLFIARVLQGNYANGNFTGNVSATLISTLGYQEYQILLQAEKNPAQFKDQVLSNSSIFGQYIPDVSVANLYLAFVKGELASEYGLPVLVNLYQQLIYETGNNIKYIQVNHNLFPSSGLNTGIFYAPSYLTDTPSYSSNGEIVPTQYYNIYASTNNGTFPLNKLPQGAIPTSYSITYTPQFYNTSIYRFVVGYPPSTVGETNGIPGLNSAASRNTVMPAWNMSNFEIVYESIPYNPHKNYAAYPSAWTQIPLQTAYTYQKENKGTVVLFPPTNQFVGFTDPIVAYYPGAIVQGRLTMPDGAPVPGVHATMFDQYGIPHQVTTTNSQGYYNLTGLPGNDTIIFSTGTLSPRLLIGTNTVGVKQFQVSQNQANRIPTKYNYTSGLPDYYFNINVKLKPTTLSGSTGYSYQQYPILKAGQKTPIITNPINYGNVILRNTQYGSSYNLSIIGGQYTVNNIPPGSYEASLYTNGHLFKNIQEVNVSLGGNVVYNLQVPFDVIFANLSVNGNPVTGLSLSATSSNGQVWASNISNSSGVAKLWVSPGNYSLTISGSNVSSVPIEQSFSGWNQNTTLNLTPRISATVSIKLNNGGNTANVEFFRNGQLSEGITALSMGGGTYAANVPYGTYTIYATSGNLSYLKTTMIKSAYSQNVTLLPSSNVTITSSMAGKTQYSGNYEILNDSSPVLLENHFLLNHTWEIKIPIGAYSFAGVGITPIKIMSGFEQMTVGASTTINISLNQNSTTSTLTYDTSISKVYNSKSAVTSGIVILNHSSSPVYFSPIGKSGYTQLYYPSYLTNEFLTVSYVDPLYVGYSTQVSSNTNNIPTNIPTSPLNVTTKVKVSGLNFNPPQSMVLTLIGPNGEFNKTLSSGLGTISVQPNLYSIKLSTGIGSNIEPMSTVLSIPSNALSQYNITAREYSSINVKGASSILIFDQNGSQMPSNIVPDGTYHVYAFNQSLGVNISTVILTANTNLSVNYVNYFTIDLANSAGLSGGTYSLKSNSVAMNISTSKIQLPLGHYNISYSNRISGSSGSFSYAGSMNLSVAGNQTVKVPVSSEEYLTDLSGTLTYGGNPSEYSTVMLLNSSGAVVKTTQSNSLGQYSMTVPTGNYAMYITNNASKAGYFGTVHIPAFIPGIPINLSLKPAYLETASVNVGPSLINNDVIVSAGGGHYAFNSSVDQILLPLGNYTFTSSISSSEIAYNGTIISVSYSESKGIFVNADSTISLTLQKVIYHDFSVHLKSAVASVNGSKEFTYNYSLFNAGNSAENVTVIPGSNSWTFNETKKYIQPGQTVNLTANVSMTGNVAAGKQQIPLKIEYNGGSKMQYLPVNVLPILNYSASQKGLSFSDGNKVVIPVLLNNTGNVKISVATAINNTELKLNGWNGTILLNNTNISSITLGFGQSKTVYISLTPYGSDAISPLTFNLTTSNSTTGYKNVTVGISSQNPPQIRPYPTGTNVYSNYTGNPYQNLIIGVIIIAGSVVTGLAVAAYRGRKK